MKSLFSFILVFIYSITEISAQSGAQRSFVSSYSSFIDYQKSFQRPNSALQRKEDTLQKQFEEKKLKWPAKYIYLRSFKYDSQLEVWVKNDIQEPFKLFKTYKVCALAGTLGPKRIEGDYQVPEGFYYINEFNPISNYYLSLRINYPNLSDRILSDSDKPGSGIYIHGSCVTVGCIPMTDQQMDELYVLAAHAKDLGQDFIPIHIFPVRFNVSKSLGYLNNLTHNDPSLKLFSMQLQDAFNYFNKYKQLPVVLIDDRGNYIVDGAPPRIAAPEVNDVNPLRPPAEHRIRNVAPLPEAVHQWPQYPGGGEAFIKYLDQLGKDMAEFLPEKVKKVYVQVEFIVDEDGVPVNFKVLKGLHDEYFNDELITRLEETMPAWQPALLYSKAVPKKMVQTITIEAE